LPKFDVAIVGAGLAGLASALALYKRQPTLQIAVLSPGLASMNQAFGFGSNQPAIASHPHFSKDHNLLSQWTGFCVPENDRALVAACELNPSSVVARGRWQIAKSHKHALDLQAQINIFNLKMLSEFHAEWRPSTGDYGALWLPSAWAIAPTQLQATWLQMLKQFNCQFFDVRVEGLRDESSDRSISLCSGVGHHQLSIEAEKVILCSPSSLYDLLDRKLRALPMQLCIPLIQWPGQSQIEISPERSAAFGYTTVQNESYAIPLGGNDWLVRDELEAGRIAFRGDRWHTPDRLPYVGPMFDANAVAASAVRFWKNDQLSLPMLTNIFINSAHGTRGLLSGIAGASVVADMLLGVNTSLPQTLSNALNPARYIRRGLRQHFGNLQSSIENS
jgi:glycine/D-amino acid oxidase-like deaminating enzyme